MEKFNIEEYNSICPTCGKNRYWIKYYVNKMIYYCQDCGYWKKIK